MIRKTLISGVGGRCNKLDFNSSYCTIHGVRPLSCDFEILRVTKHKNHNHITNRFFGRGWSFIQIHSGQRGALCELFTPTEEGRNETVRKLYRLKEWSDYLGLYTYLPRVIDWVANIPLSEQRGATFEVGNAASILTHCIPEGETREIETEILRSSP